MPLCPSVVPIDTLVSAAVTVQHRLGGSSTHWVMLAEHARRRPSRCPSWRWAGCHLPALRRDRPRPDQIYQADAGEHLPLAAVDRRLQLHRRARAAPSSPSRPARPAAST
eukprot:COSAG06_NODE_41491_length_391_cov_0.414384_1_plen_109_part_10